MKIGRCTAWVCAVGMVFVGALLGPAPDAASQELISFFTPPPGGVAYILGAGILSVSNKYMPETKLIHEATTGTMDIVRRMMQRADAKKPCFGIFGAVDGFRAYKGEGEYGGKAFAALRHIAYLNATDLYLVVPDKSPIKSYADVKGKRIGMGGPGSTVANTAMFLIEQHGVKKEDFKPLFFTYRETVEGIQDGSLDGGFVAGGYPIAAYTELSSRHAVRIVPVDGELLKKILPDRPYYYDTVIKAKSYKGLEKDTLIMGFGTIFWSHEGTSADYVYKLIKNLFDHKDEYYAIHTSAKDMTKESVLKGKSIPLHAGAEKYYKEIGLLK
jgi:uncharacterized protein